MVREMGMMQVTPVADREIRAKARELMSSMSLGDESMDALADLSEGFAELSAMADARRKFKAACVAKALSAILKRPPEGNPEDLPYIIHIAMNFLDSLLGQVPGQEEFLP